MKFECGDLERAFANPDLMTDAREHLRHCAACRDEYRIWNEISSTAKQLHQTWDSPDLWLRIHRGIEQQRPLRKRRWTQWKAAALAVAAATIAVVALLCWPQLMTFNAPTNGIRPATGSPRDFLTEQALRNVENSEAAYRRSIDELSRLAQPQLESHTVSPLVASYRERLLMLDSAIQETRSNVAQNRFNIHLQRELADLYRDKQQTLEEILTSGQRR
ncbi:MAG TPA: hypothetical protein VFA65_10710 [Bryobacteraceae bacterium]|nr:hypothetical protein [Bryobacteraceae bacterium]